jgi:hypothetical protein
MRVDEQCPFPLQFGRGFIAFMSLSQKFPHIFEQNAAGPDSAIRSGLTVLAGIPHGSAKIHE